MSRFAGGSATLRFLQPQIHIFSRMLPVGGWRLATQKLVNPYLGSHFHRNIFSIRTAAFLRIFSVFFNWHPHSIKRSSVLRQLKQLVRQSDAGDTSTVGFVLFQRLLYFYDNLVNYLVSGLSCEWYFGHPTSWYTPVKRLFCKNLGSVAGGSFLSSLFFLPSLFFSIIAPKSDWCLCNFFDLTRSDVYTWIYLSGNSYCNSSRQTQYLCNRSATCRSNESLISVYTVVSRVVVALIGLMIVYWIARDNMVESKVPAHLLLGMFFICLYVTCYCSDLHALVA